MIDQARRTGPTLSLGLQGAARAATPLLPWAMAVWLAASPASVAAQSAQVEFEAQLGIARPTGASPQVGAGGLAWRCEAKRCTAKGTQTRKPADLCRSLAERVGVLAAFRARGAWSLSALELEQCNRGLAPAAKSVPAAPRTTGAGAAATAAASSAPVHPLDAKAAGFVFEQEWAVSVRNARGTGTTATHPNFSGRTAAMTGFHFAFHDGDHKVKAIVLLQQDGAFTATFADNDGNDGFDATAWYRVLPREVRLQQAQASGCRGSCTVSIPHVEGMHFALGGFEVRFEQGDHNLRSFSIKPVSGGVVVTLKDNSGSAPFAARIQYFHVPLSRILVGSSSRTVGGKRPGGSQHVSASVPYGVRMLRGFSFQFENGDHHVKELGISATFQSDGLKLSFNDSNFDDPAAIYADFLLLK